MKFDKDTSWWNIFLYIFRLMFLWNSFHKIWYFREAAISFDTVDQTQLSFWKQWSHHMTSTLVFVIADLNLFRVSNGNAWGMCEICSELTRKTLEWRHWRYLIVNFDQISYIFLVLIYWLWKRKYQLGNDLKNGIVLMLETFPLTQQFFETQIKTR